MMKNQITFRKKINQYVPLLKKSIKYVRNPQANRAQIQKSLLSYGLEITKKVEIPIDQLVVVNLPKCYHSSKWEGDLRQFHFLDELLTNENGIVDRSIPNSMHVKLLKDHFDKNIDFKETLYWKMRKEYQDAGLFPKSDETILKQIENFISLYYSIKNFSFCTFIFSNNLFILEKPFISSRYGVDYEPGGFEMWLGHHRAAVLWYLGYRSVPAYFMRDIIEKNRYNGSQAALNRFSG